MKRFITITQLDSSEQQRSGENLPIILGSGSEADIHLPECDSIAAYIGDSQGHLFVQPSETNRIPLFHNNHHLTESKWLKSQDQITCGKIIISYEKKGDQLFFVVSEQKTVPPQSLQPPQDPPPDVESNAKRVEPIPINITNNSPRTRKKKLLFAALTSLFLILGLAVLFVLIARPLELDISPPPDSVTLHGFPPAIKLGERYLCIPGNYSVHLEKQGYHPFEKEITILSNQENRMSARLEKLPGILDLVITPENGISIYSDDRIIGTTPPHSFKVIAGKHLIKLEKERYKPFITEINIEGAGEAQTLEATLEPDWAEVSITSTPAGGEVIIDGTVEGITPLTLDLLSGSHQILVKTEQYVTVEAELMVTAGIPGMYEYPLKLLPGVLDLKTIPEGAVVTVDGTYRGTTPATISVPSRSDHEILFTLPGHKPFRQQINLEPGEAVKHEISLEQEKGVVYLTTHPPGATVTINGTKYGRNQGRLVLPADKQVFEVRAPGHKPETRTIMPKIGFSQQLIIELSPEPDNTTSPSPAAAPSEPETSLGQKLLLVQPSPFTMGAPRREPGRRANERERMVVLKRPYYLSEKLVTNKEYRYFKNNHLSGSVSAFSLNDDSQPVVNVTWEDAIRYLNWLSVKDNLNPFYITQDQGFIAASPPTNGYRLPTEAEWSFAARLGSEQRQRFPWSDSFPPREPLGNYSDRTAAGLLPRVIQGYNDGYAVSSPVGSFPANKGGFFDMGGNVAEWCHDFYSAHTSTLSNQADPLGPDSGTHHVIRGSSWKDATITELRLSYRAYHREARENVGFRIARYQ